VQWLETRELPCNCNRRVASSTMLNMPCRFYSDDEDERFFDCSSRRSSSADVADAMAGLDTGSGTLKTASGSSDRGAEGRPRIQGEPDWIA
jgi:hypothetical protein